MTTTGEDAREPEGPRPILYVDLDNTLVDFGSGIARLPEKARETYKTSTTKRPEFSR